MKISELHNKYSNELQITYRSYFSWKSFNNLASRNNNLFDGLHQTANTWNIILYSLQLTFMMSLRRIFDNSKITFSVDLLLQLCIENISEFNKESNIKRKFGEYEKLPEYIDEYEHRLYEAQKKDIQFLRGEIKNQKRIFDMKFKELINKKIAHTELSLILDNNKSLAGGTIGELEGIINVLYQIDMILFDLIHNGRLEKIGAYKFNAESYIIKDAANILKKMST